MNSKTLDVIAIIVGWLGAAIMFKGGEVLESAPVWTSPEMAVDMKQRNVRRQKWQRLGFALVTLSLALQTAAKFVS